MSCRLSGADARRRIGHMPEGTVGMVLVLVGLLSLLAGLALPEGVTSTAIHILAIGFFAGAFVFSARDYAKSEPRGQ
jgi:hypothetical protein